MKRLRALVSRTLGSAVVQRRMNGWLAVLWVAMLPIALLTPLKVSIPFLVGTQIWSLVAGHWGAWQAAVVGVAQDEDAKVQDVIDHIDRKL